MTTVDWTVLEIEGVMEVAERAARKVAGKYENTTEVEDMLQEAYIILALMPQRVRECSEGVRGATLGTLCYELEHDLVDKIKRTAEKRSQLVSRDFLIERVAAVDL